MNEASIFAAALEKTSAEQRAAYVAEACGGDEKLRRRVEILLRAQAEPDDLLDPSSAKPGTVNYAPLAEGPGTVIGPYKLLQKIGEGGMGVVYMAEQQQPVRRAVALKIIKPGMDSGQVIARFESERQALALMEHPNIARVLDAGTTASGLPYFVMELVKGVPITKFCDEHQLSPRERLELFVPVCQAVQHAHQKGIIHRDLKPSNVLIAMYDDKPVPKIIDFGVAKATSQKLTEKTLFTEFGSIIGTLEYMSPEQAKLNALDIDTRSDVYALGVLLYELLTGSTPLEHGRLRELGYDEMLRLIREEEPPRPSTRLSSSMKTLPAISLQRKTEPAQLTKLLRGELDWIVLKALEKDRIRRYDTASAFVRDIERYLKNEPVEACPPSPTYRLRKFVKRNKGLVLATAAVAMTLLAGIAGTTWGLVKAQEQSRAAVKQRDRAELEKIESDKQRLDAETARNEADKQRQHVEEERNQKTAQLSRAEGLVYDLQYRDAYHLFQSFDLRQCRQVLAECRPDLRGSEYGYLTQQMEIRLRTLRGESGHWTVWSGDGNWLASSKDGAVKVLDLETGKENLLNGLIDGLTCLALSADGKRLFTANGDGIKMWDVVAGKEILALRGQTKAECLVPSDDGKRLVSGSRSDNTIKVWDLETGKAIFALPTPAVLNLTLSRDGKRLVSPIENGIKVWDLETGKETFTLGGHTKQVYCVVLSGDGKLLFSASADSTIKIWNPETGKEIRTLHGHGTGVLDLVLSGDGQRLFSASGDQTIKMWDVETGKEIRTLSGHNNAVLSLALSSDGKRLFSTSDDHTIKMWDVETGEETLTLRGQTTAFSLALSIDGKRLISRSRDNVIEVWNLETGKETRSLPGPRGHVVSLAVSSNGKRVFLGDGFTIKMTGDGGLQVVFPDSSIHERDLEAGKEIRKLGEVADGGGVSALALSPGNQRLFSGGLENAFSPNAVIKVWDLQTGKVIRTLRGHTQAILSLVPSLDGKRLASSSGDGSIRVWELETGAEIRLLHGQAAGGEEGQLLPLALARDGKRLFSGGQADKISVWDVNTGKEIRTLTHEGSVLSLALSDDGKRLISGSSNSTIKDWDLETGKEIHALHGYSGDIGALALSRDGKRLFSGGGFFFGDNTIKVWDLATGQELLTLPGHAWGVACLALSGDGKRLVSVGRDGTVKIWDMDAGIEALTAVASAINERS